MKNTVRDITARFVCQLPSNDEFIRIEELRALDIPYFIVDRIELDIGQKIRDSLTPPATQWADMDNRRVQGAWDHLVDVVCSESCLPSSQAESVILRAVADVLKLLLQPRKMIPERLFGSDDVLDREELEKRVETVVVNRNLADAPLKYLDRKELELLTFEQCSNVVSKVDERLAIRYNALGWVALVEPFFALSGDSINPHMLMHFFSDKRRPAIARIFGSMSEPVTRSGLMNVLTIPGLLDPSTGKEQSTGTEQPTVQRRSGEKIDDVDRGIGVEKEPAGQKISLKKQSGEQKTAGEKSAAGKAETSGGKKGADEDPETDKKREAGEGGFAGNGPAGKGLQYPGLEKAVNRTSGVEKESGGEDNGTHAGKEADDRRESPGQNTEDDDEEEIPLHKRFMFDESQSGHEEHEEDPDEEQLFSFNTMYAMLDETEEEKTVWDAFSSSAETKSKESTREENVKEADAESSAAEKVVKESQTAPEEQLEELNAREDSFTQQQTERGDEVETGDEEEPEVILGERFTADRFGSGEAETYEPDEEDQKEDESLFWQQFMGKEDDQDEEGEGPFETGEGPVETIVERSKESAGGETGEADALFRWLGDDSERIIQEIFRGSQRAFESAIEELAAMDEWRSAAEYIENEIFSKNHIYMYTEVAVDFTDRLQSWFTQHKSSKSSS